MAKDPAFLFYPNDWLGGTMGMSFAEKGAYMELLMMQFNRGHMTTDMIGHTVGQLWDKIQHKFRLDESGLWFNERLDLEKEKRKLYVKSRNNNMLGKNQHQKKQSKEQKSDGHMTSHMENENENENISLINKRGIDFDIFWDLYDKKVGNLDKLKTEWEGLTYDEQTAAIKHIPKYKKSKSDKVFIKNPLTYLVDKSFNDEIISINGNEIKPIDETFSLL